MDDLESISDLELYIDNSQLLILFASRGYWLSRNCLREARAALEQQKPWLFVHEADSKKGGLGWQEMVAEVPDDCMPLVDDCVYDVVPWIRLSRFQYVSLKQIAQALVLSMPKYSKLLDRERSGPRGQGVVLYTTDEEPTGRAYLRKPTPIYVSSANPGALAVAIMLCEHIDNLEVDRRRHVIRSRPYLLTYLLTYLRTYLLTYSEGM